MARYIRSTCFVCLDKQFGSARDRAPVEEALKYFFAKMLLYRLDSFQDLVRKYVGNDILFVECKSLLFLQPESTFDEDMFPVVAMPTLNHLKRLLRQPLSSRTQKVLQDQVKQFKRGEEFIVVMSCTQTGAIVGGINFVDPDSSLLKMLGKERFEERGSVKIPFGEKMTDPTECTACGNLFMVLEPCAYCRRATYCSGECQHTHWVLHRESCDISASRKTSPRTACKPRYGSRSQV